MCVCVCVCVCDGAGWGQSTEVSVTLTLTVHKFISANTPRFQTGCPLDPSLHFPGPECNTLNRNPRSDTSASAILRINHLSQTRYPPRGNRACLHVHPFLSGISELSFDPLFLSPFVFFCPVLVLIPSCRLSADGPDGHFFPLPFFQEIP